ncbi:MULTISPECIES: spore cortex-lytic enzyme [Solibacillus]|uniref:Spore cortex-lytic enzyme n=1 Tax=Solibacillus merdavium TaxID=2762218 RepID=A0ABR8XJ90_9BACL|nr:spore cortex-lytic enzyme [Solibacillus merdavium]MBD8031995.1 spore cortex-lytic enzyme [Solibacillus merdavium]
MSLKKIVLFILILSGSFASHTIAFSDQEVQRGAFGDDVVELQARLQYLSFYHGKIDGKFGYGTYWALRNFQEQYGLPVDGIAGQKTKEKLVNNSDFDRAFVHEQINAGNQFTYYGGIPLKDQVKKSGTAAGTGSNKESGKGSNLTDSMQLPPGYSEQDLQILANAVYGEARGEPYEGQVAVAAVILNRLESPEFPDTISEIIFQPLAFTAVADGQIWLTPNERAKQAVLDAINGWDPSENALYYFNPVTATSKWIWSRPQIKQIGEHIFCL